MPGARMLKIVTMKLIAPNIDAKPTNWSEMAQSVWPPVVVRLKGG